ncbi:MAG TPA: peptidoglycan DD-metalloendopeptidase family protein [Thermodesulfobacteriota bacterium]|nr:peptidoglycan DD-metalloendopeptidase family protein [Thermodesulfobacteriota bacterium]
MEKTRFYTVLIIPGAAARVRRLQFPVPWVKRGGIAALVLLVLALAAAVDYVSLRLKSFELASLRALTKAQEAQLVAFAKKVDELEAEMARVRTLDQKLRQITGLEERQRTTQTVAVGGGASLEEQPAGRLELTRQGLVEQMHRDLALLSEQAAQQVVSLKELEAHLEAQRVQLASTPSIWPVRGWVTSGFGQRVSPFTEEVQIHEGIDIAGPIGTPIVAPAAGVVTFVGNNGGYGLSLTLDHGYGIETRYGHLDTVKVKLGQRVKRHQVIATLGNSGRSTGPHLHYEVRVNSIPVNPAKYILN